LRLSLNRFDTNPRLRDLGEELERIILEWMRATDVGWCLVREDRPEIVVPRDRDSEISWFRAKTVSVWGCGAIGSHVADFLARAGIKKLILRDKSIVSPGIITRQLFADADIGKPKVSALAARLKAIRPDIEIEEHTDDLLSGPLSAEDWTDGADVVIETTGAGTAMVKGEAARRRGERRIPFVSMALGHAAKNAMLHIAGPDYSGGVLDIDRKLRQECYRRPDLREYIDNREPKQVLLRGQRKSIQEDRVVLVPGPQHEVDCVREIFRMFVEEQKMPKVIAHELNARGLKYEVHCATSGIHKSLTESYAIRGIQAVASMASAHRDYTRPAFRFRPHFG
jgi:molybdopterin/thiamine biosynthesis adenylyltransferase